jgi:hypothetical protein
LKKPESPAGVGIRLEQRHNFVFMFLAMTLASTSAKSRTCENLAKLKLPNSVADRGRPLCPYPLTARWNGTGSTDRAENFTCGRS